LTDPPEFRRVGLIIGWRFLLFCVRVLSVLAQEKIKVIVDQDARGPGTSDQQAILVFLQIQAVH